MTLMRALCFHLSAGAWFAASLAKFRTIPSDMFSQACLRGSKRQGAVAQVVSVMLALIVTTICAPGVVDAASINYGNFNIPPAGIMFQGVTESSGTDPVPMYGPPAPFFVGLDFDPTNFVSTSANGSADITDGQLNFTIMGLVSPSGYVGVNAISLFEAGDYSLAGAGGAGTSVVAGAILRATVTQINGSPVAPLNLNPVNASFSDSLPGLVAVAPWSLGLFMDIGAQLAGLGFGPSDVATKIDVSVNNALISTSEPGSVAFIAKKEFQIRLDPERVGNPFIPEPNTLLLASLAMCGWQFATGRHRAVK